MDIQIIDFNRRKLIINYIWQTKCNKPTIRK